MGRGFRREDGDIQPGPIILSDAMWKQLGVDGYGANVTLKDDAPLSAVRHALVMGSAGAKAARAATPDGRNSRAANPVANSPLAVFAGRTAKSK